MVFTKYVNVSALLIAIILLGSCGSSKKTAYERNKRAAETVHGKERVAKYEYKPSKSADKKSVITPKVFGAPLSINRNDFVEYAQKFLGVPYKYGGSEPATGFDCSGFVGYVFRNFNVAAPRTSISYTNAGQEVKMQYALPGDIILFSTNSDTVNVGHLGIVVNNEPGKPLRFIHSATSKNIGVILSDFKGYYERRFVKIVRVLK